MLNTEHETMADACWPLEREMIATALCRHNMHAPAQCDAHVMIKA